MRKAFVVAGLVLCSLPAALAAQGQAPAVSTPQPTCAELRADAQREHDERERARIAASDDGVRYAFFFECPLAAAGEDDGDWGITAFRESQTAADAQSASWSLPAASPAASSAASSSPMVTRRAPPARTETAEEFYNRQSPPAGSVAQAQVFADREGNYARSATAEVGGGTFQNESSYNCTETLLERTCTSGGSVTFSSGDDGGAAARALLEQLRRDD